MTGALDVFSMIESTRTADEIVWQVEKLVLDGVLRPGERLPGERELAMRLGVSRPVLREALAALENKALIESRRGDGTYVADLIGEVFASPMMSLISSHPESALQYLEYRHDIDGLAADYAARRATHDDRQMLDAVMARMERAFLDADDDMEWRIDVEFHTVIGECAHNLILLHTLRSCYRLLNSGVFINRSLILRMAGMREELFMQHKTIADAVRHGDPDAARTAAQAHIDFIIAKMRDAERSGDYERVSRLRLLQRNESGTDSD